MATKSRVKYVQCTLEVHVLTWGLISHDYSETINVATFVGTRLPQCQFLLPDAAHGNELHVCGVRAMQTGHRRTPYVALSDTMAQQLCLLPPRFYGAEFQQHQFNYGRKRQVCRMTLFGETNTWDTICHLIKTRFYHEEALGHKSYEAGRQLLYGPLQNERRRTLKNNVPRGNHSQPGAEHCVYQKDLSFPIIWKGHWILRQKKEHTI